MDAVAEKAVSAADTLAARVEAAQQELQAGIDRAGLRDDPFRHPMQALSTVMGLFPAFAEEITAAINQARQPADPAMVKRLETAAATGAATQAGKLARAHTLRTILIGTALLIGSNLLTGAGGLWWGRSSQAAAIASTDAKVTAAFRDGPGAASAWVNLMELNDLPHALALCTGQRSYLDAGGRRVCLVPLYIEPAGKVAAVK